MFGRRQKQDAEARREQERRALFARLAERPDHVCPFLGLADERTDYHPGASEDHRCYAFGDPAPLSDEQQTRVCLQRGYGNCPRYLRGVLVIPTEELEALRRPQAPRPAPPPPPAEPAERRRRGAPVILLPLLLLLLVVGAGGALAFVMFGGGRNGGVGVASPPGSPVSAPVAATTAPTPSVAPTPTSTPTATLEPTEVPTATPELTPAPDDQFVGYDVQVDPGSYTIFQVDELGQIVSSRSTPFDERSHVLVERVVAPNGLLHWRVLEAGHTGWSYIVDQSGEFTVREVYVGADGTLRYAAIPADQR